VWEFVTKLRDNVEDLELRLRTTQKNVASVRAAASAWSREPLYTRGKTKNPLPIPKPTTGDITSSNKRQFVIFPKISPINEIICRFREVKETGLEIQKLMKENKQLFSTSIEPNSDKSEDKDWLVLWSDYEDYVDDIVSKCLQQAIGCRLELFLSINKILSF
jgi:hypothetical protein